MDCCFFFDFFVLELFFSHINVSRLGWLMSLFNLIWPPLKIIRLFSAMQLEKASLNYLKLVFNCSLKISLMFNRCSMSILGHLGKIPQLLTPAACSLFALLSVFFPPDIQFKCLTTTLGGNINLVDLKKCQVLFF